MNTKTTGAGKIAKTSSGKCRCYIWSTYVHNLRFRLRYRRVTKIMSWRRRRRRKRRITRRARREG
jgi:hypothetical protein